MRGLARTIKIDLPPFTLVGATTRSGLLTTPLRDRFGIQIRMEFYNPNDLVKILLKQAEKLEVVCTKVVLMRLLEDLEDS